MKTLDKINIKTIKDYITNFLVSSNKFDYKCVQDWKLIGDPNLRIGGYY